MGPRLESPAEVVRWLGAVQAQDYNGATWALGLRTDAATRASVDEAFDSGQILRTHVLRPTWHFVPPEDARMLLELTGPRVMAGVAGRHRRLELDRSVITAAESAFVAALDRGRHLTRPELGSVLEEAGISPEGQRLPHLIMAAELEGLVISGPRRGRQLTYALLDERAPGTAPVARDEALGRLALRYFESHGPALLQDFAWWSGLTLKEARAGLASAAARLDRARLDDKDYYWLEAAVEPGAAAAVHLLPNFDELTVAYRDRSALHDAAATDLSIFSFGSILANVVTVGGRIIGAWRRVAGARGLRLEVRLLVPGGETERTRIEGAAAELGRFTGLAPDLVWA